MRWRASATACRPTCCRCAVNEVGQVGPEAVAALFAYGAAGARFLAPARPQHDIDGPAPHASTPRTSLLDGLGYGAGRCGR